MNKEKYLELLNQYSWQFALLDKQFEEFYKKSNIIVEYFINHFNDFLNLKFKTWDERDITMLEFLKEHEYPLSLSPEKLLRKIESDWANVLHPDYANSYCAAKEALPKELQDKINSL